MDGGLDVAARQEAQGVAGVDCQAPVEGLGPLPVPCLVVSDLQRRDGLPEEQGDCAEVGVSERPEAVAQLLELLGRELGVLHVPEVRLIVSLPPVRLGEEVGRQLQGEGDEMKERVEDLVVELFCEGLDEGLLVLEELGQRLSDVAVLG